MKYYSFDDVACARIIIERPELFNNEFHHWADKVTDWFNTYLRLCRLYHTILKDWQLSVAAVWQTIKTIVKKRFPRLSPECGESITIRRAGIRL